MNEDYSAVFSALVRRLKTKNYHISAAESCTAGLFSAYLADVPGASRVLSYGFVVYSEEAKNRVLDVPLQTIGEYGVVSEQTAAAMAKGAAEISRAEVAVAVTGFAGPESDGVLPVGRVCFAYVLPGRLITETRDFGAVGRNLVRQRAAVHAAQTISSLLEELPCD